ncbi:MAG: hypothetical protein ACE5RJ_04630 [Nitrosopumilaceae archaeon]
METGSHDLVKRLIEEFQSANLEITYANCEGYKKPEPINGYTPDVIAWDSEKEIYYLGTVADPANFNSKEMEDKIQTLSNLMMRKGNSTNTQIPYYIGIPRQHNSEISELIEQKILESDNVLTMEF